MDGFQRKDIVSIDSDSLRELSLEQETIKAKRLGSQAVSRKHKLRMEEMFRRLPSYNQKNGGKPSAAMYARKSRHLPQAQIYTHNLHKTDLFGQVLPDYMQN